MANSAVLNSWLQPVQFGQGFGFLLDLPTAPSVPGQPDGSTFIVALLDADFNPQRTTSGYEALRIDLFPGQPPAVTLFAASPAEGSIASVLLVPEPSSILLMALGLVALSAVARRRR